MFNGGHAPLPPPKARVISQAPTLPPIIVPHGRSSTYRPGAIASHFSPGPSSSGRYGPVAPPTASHSANVLPPVSNTTPARAAAQAAAAAHERQQLAAVAQQRVAISALENQTHKLRESIQNKSGSPFAAITGALTLHGLDKFLQTATPNLGKDLANLPKSTLEGSIQTAEAIAHDISHSSLPGTSGALYHPGEKTGSAFGNQITGMVTNDPIVQAISKGSLDPIAKHPLQTIFDATGLYSGLGKGLGAVGRGVGEAAGKPFIDRPFSRGDVNRPIVPGFAAQTNKFFSGNAFSKPFQRAVRNMSQARVLNKQGEAAAQALADQHGLPLANARGEIARTQPHLVRKRFFADRIQPLAAGHNLRSDVSLTHVGERGVTAAQAQQLAKALRKVKPTHVTTKTVRQDAAAKYADFGPTIRPPKQALAAAAPWSTLFGATHEGLANALAHVQEGLQGQLYADSTHAFRDNMRQHAANLQAVLDDPKLQANPAKLETQLQKVVDTYAAHQSPLEASKGQLGILDPEKAAGALNRRIAAAHIPDSVLLRRGESVTDPTWHADMRAARGDVKGARQALDQAIAEHHGLREAHAASLRTMTQMMRRLPLNPATDSAMTHFIGLRHAVAQNAKDVRPITEKAVAEARVNLRGAEAARNALARNPRKLSGTLVPDANAMPIKSGRLAGLKLRQIQHGDVAPVLDQHPVHYFRMTAPEASLRQDMHSTIDNLGKPRDTSNVTATGEATYGGFTPGWGTLARSQVGDVRTVGMAREFQNFLARHAAPTHYADQHSATIAAEQLHAHSGIPAAAVVDHAGDWRVVPKPALDELKSQLKQDYPNRGARGAMNIGRQFRNTVLTFSPKLPIMHTVESTVRSALQEKGNPITGALDLARGNAMMKATGDKHDPLNDPQRAYAQNILVPGGQPGAHGRVTAEDMGRLEPKQRGAIKQAGHAAATAYDKFSSTIIGIQRALVGKSEALNLGREGRMMLHEAGHSWLDANLNVKKYADELARGIADPILAERAARSMHDAMGKYQAWTAKTRGALRFMPFAPWYINAARLVYIGLPKDHPILNAFLNDTALANQQQWDAQHKGLPSDMGATANEGPSQWLDIGKFTPVGLEKNPIKEVANLAIPQYMGALSALIGQDPFGNNFVGPNTPHGKQEVKAGIRGDSPLQALALAAEQQIGALGGPFNDISRILYGKGGGTMYNTSTPIIKMLTGGALGSVAIKPGSAGHQKMGPLGGFLGPGLDRVIDPFHPTYYNTKGGKDTGGSTTGTGSGNGAGRFRLGPTLPSTTIEGVGKMPSHDTPAQQAALKAIIAQRMKVTPGVMRGGTNVKGPAKLIVKFDKHDMVGGFRAYVIRTDHGTEMHFPPGWAASYAKYSKSSPGNPAFSSWLHQAPIHEVAHTHQSVATGKERALREGGAQAYTDMVDPRHNIGDTNYHNMVQAVRLREGPQWIAKGQFTPANYGPAVNFPLSAPSQAAFARLGANASGHVRQVANTPLARLQSIEHIHPVKTLPPVTRMKLQKKYAQ